MSGVEAGPPGPPDASAMQAGGDASCCGYTADTSELDTANQGCRKLWMPRHTPAGR